MVVSATGSLWGTIDPVYREILRHPFVTGLVDGTLPTAAFTRYIVQDGLFLADYARALAVCGARAPDLEDVTLFCGHAAEAVAVERDLQRSLMARLGVPSEEAAAAEPSPTCVAYTSFLLASCSLGDWAEAIAAVLPCYWIYREVGRALVEAGSPDPRYSAWIETYAGDEFGDAADAVIAAADRALTHASPASVSRAGRRALTAARMEWRFWDSAYHGEPWMG